jgi:succinate dehydrogenase / fumarate reductase, flavoprotein subunit
MRSRWVGATGGAGRVVARDEVGPGRGRYRRERVCDQGRGVGPTGLGVYLDFADAIERLGRAAVVAKYGSLFDMYQQITREDPYQVPMRIYPAAHYVMGGLWMDYDLQSNIPGVFVVGEANFSDHGANPLGASALMQGPADGYFVLPNTINDYLSAGPFDQIDTDHPAMVDAVTSVRARIQTLLGTHGSRSVAPSTRSSGRSCGSTAAWSARTRACWRASRRFASCGGSAGEGRTGC